MPTAKGLAILAAGKQEQVLGQVKFRLAALFLACRGQRHVVRGDADRLDVGRGQAAVAALARRSPELLDCGQKLAVLPRVRKSR